MKPLEILNASKIRLGHSTDKWQGDRGFSPESTGIHLTKERGVVYAQPAETDRGTNLTGNVVASVTDPAYLGNDMHLVDDEGAFYTLDGATLTKRQTDGSGTYQLGTTDLIVFKGNTYSTPQANVTKLTGSDMTAIDATWWTVTEGHGALSNNYRHPMEVVEDTLYIADQNDIHTYDGTTSVASAMSLPTGVNITSLRKHPDGRHLIAFCGATANFSHTIGATGKIYLIDTVTLEFVREIKVDSQVEGSILVGGVVFVTYGTVLGFFNGDGIQPIPNSQPLASQTTYSHNLGNMEDILLVRDTTSVLAYGDVGKGNVFWKIYKNATNSNPINNVHYKGDNKLVVGFSDGSGGGELMEMDYDSAGVEGLLVCNRIDFGSKVWIRRIDIEHTKSNPSGTTEFVVSSKDVEDALTTLKTVTYSSQSITRTEIHTNVQAQIFQLQLAWGTDDVGVRSVTIWYESAE